MNRHMCTYKHACSLCISACTHTHMQICIRMCVCVCIYNMSMCLNVCFSMTGSSADRVPGCILERVCSELREAY